MPNAAESTSKSLGEQCRELTIGLANWKPVVPLWWSENRIEVD